jgi:Holliday junction resolvase RusA-like endonuclease
MSGGGKITIFLAGSPHGKGRPRFATRKTSAGKQIAVPYTPADTRKYESSLGMAAQQQMVGRRLLEGPVRVRVVSGFPVPQSWPKKKQEAALRGEIRPTKKPDWDNLAKVTDALDNVVWVDDSQVVEGSVRKVYSDRPGLYVEVEAL